ncbi:MAG: sulfotransferase, partial [Candidatus Aegiribacteria sp.]|nr:sulfotransferase [Candidatus Aegiribacteria sp.]
LALAPRSNNISQKPIFIVGMPRSGTTLVEHILSAHPDVEGIGEKTYIGNMAKNIASEIGSVTFFPQCISEINRNQLSQFAKEQEEHLQEFSCTAKRISNKLPENFFYLGLISLIFPKARIIHCQRRPSDTIISIFLQNFIDPLDFSHKIENIISYYHEYLRLMNHWRQVIDLEILEIGYEELVLEQEQGSRQLLKFIDLEWNPACLDFHRQQRLVLTASRDQLKRPIYKSSLNRWRNYEKQLSPWLTELNQLNKITGY